VAVAIGQSAEKIRDEYVKKESSFAYSLLAIFGNIVKISARV
jgi:hypothetical protein